MYYSFLYTSAASMIVLHSINEHPWGRFVWAVPFVIYIIADLKNTNSKIEKPEFKSEENFLKKKKKNSILILSFYAFFCIFGVGRFWFFYPAVTEFKLKEDLHISNDENRNNMIKFGKCRLAEYTTHRGEKVLCKDTVLKKGTVITVKGSYYQSTGSNGHFYYLLINISQKSKELNDIRRVTLKQGNSSESNPRFESLLNLILWRNDILEYQNNFFVSPYEFEWNSEKFLYSNDLKHNRTGKLDSFYKHPRFFFVFGMFQLIFIPLSFIFYLIFLYKALRLSFKKE
ncbi:MAG: hypothetical protein GY909_19120 [Oligoflexia bacterium]|nr:hypothetical protein [Oligoflexia bacterium]